MRVLNEAACLGPDAAVMTLKDGRAALMHLVGAVNNFGYGPASGLIDTISATTDIATWRLYSTGQALEFLKWNMPGQAFADLDLWSADNWRELAATTPPTVPIVVVSHPRLVRFLGEQGHHVIHFDQLDWMWPAEWLHHQLEQPPALHLIQPFLTSTLRPLASHQRYVRPIWRDPLPTANISSPTEASTLVVAFGGMGVAGVESASDQYALWVVDVLHDALRLTNSAAGWRVMVIGGSGSFADQVRQVFSELSVSRGFVREEYLRTLRSSRRQVLSPGLATIYETAALGLTPFFQPGANKSMVLQLDALQRLSYRQLRPWPWQVEALRRAPILSEPDLLAWIRTQMDASMADPAFRRDLASQIAAYLETEPGEPLRVPLWDTLPSAAQALRQYLEAL